MKQVVLPSSKQALPNEMSGQENKQVNEQVSKWANERTSIWTCKWTSERAGNWKRDRTSDWTDKLATSGRERKNERKKERKKEVEQSSDNRCVVLHLHLYWYFNGSCSGTYIHVLYLLQLLFCLKWSVIVISIHVWQTDIGTNGWKHPLTKKKQSPRGIRWSVVPFPCLVTFCYLFWV